VKTFEKLKSTYSEMKILGMISLLSRSKEPEVSKYFEIFRDIYGNYFNVNPVWHGEALRAQQWHGFMSEVISFLYLIDNKFNVFTEAEKDFLERVHGFSKYSSKAKLMDAHLGLCEGCLAYGQGTHYLSKYEWWSKILQEQLELSLQQIGCSPAKKNELYKEEAEKILRLVSKTERILTRGQNTNVKIKECHLVCELTSLSQWIMKEQKDKGVREFIKTYWNEYRTARNSWLRFL
jgi:hypothetical protein